MWMYEYMFCLLAFCWYSYTSIIVDALPIKSKYGALIEKMKINLGLNYLMCLWYFLTLQFMQTCIRTSVWNMFRKNSVQNVGACIFSCFTLAQCCTCHDMRLIWIYNLTLSIGKRKHFCRWRPGDTLDNLSYVFCGFLYGTPTPDFERTSASFWLRHWSQCDDMPSIKGDSTVDRNLSASTDLVVYNPWRSDLCLDDFWETNDADHCSACMRASVLTVCTPFSIHNITLWYSCRTPVSPTSSSDFLKTQTTSLPA